MYDPTNPLPGSRSILFSSESLVRHAVYDSSSLPVKQNHLRNKRYVRTKHASTLDDGALRSADIGYFLAATVNAATDVVYGDLFVEYTVRLIGPRAGHATTKSAVVSELLTSVHGAGDHIDMHNGNQTNLEMVKDRSNQDAENTLAIDTYQVGGGGYSRGGKAFVPYRIKFHEPFQGTMQIYKAPLDATDTNIGVWANNTGFIRPADAPRMAHVAEYKEDATALAAHYGVPGAMHTQSFVVKAEAGDVVDLTANEISATSTDWMGTVKTILTEAAPLVLDALLATIVA